MTNINELIFQTISESFFMDKKAKKEHESAIKSGKIFFDIRKVNSNSKGKDNE